MTVYFDWLLLRASIWLIRLGVGTLYVVCETLYVVYARRASDTVRAKADGLRVTEARLKDEVDERRAAAKVVRSKPDDELPPVGVNISDYIDTQCPLCLGTIHEADEVAVCIEGRVAYHLECARRNRGCKTPGCRSYVYLHPSGKVRSWRRVVAG